MAHLAKRRLGAMILISSALIGVQAGAQSDAETKPTIAEITEAWLASPHANGTSESFTHWDEDGEIPGTCAVCHSSTGVIDYLSGPMSLPGVIEHSVGIGTSVDCAACHNPAATALGAVPFPSGTSVGSLGSSAICTVCHQGRASTVRVETATAGLDDDVIAGDLGFINVHYAPSAASLMGGVARGGFEYPGKDYKGQFTHVPNLSTCTDCHNPHSLEVEIASCTTCHSGAETFADIRTSPTDFDGDGDTGEGISDPIQRLHARLEAAIMQYAAEVSSAPVVYSAHAFPYFFADSDGDGTASASEAIFPNRYQSWTPRLLKAAYNYQLIAKEPAIYAHNPHYALQLLYDSLEDLGQSTEIDISDLTRP